MLAWQGRESAATTSRFVCSISSITGFVSERADDR